MKEVTRLITNVLFIGGQNYQSLDSPCENNTTASLPDSRLEVMLIILTFVYINYSIICCFYCFTISNNYREKMFYLFTETTDSSCWKYLCNFYVRFSIKFTIIKM